MSLFTLAEGEIGELHVGLKGTMNALFLKDLRKRRGEGWKVGFGKAGPAAVFASATTLSASTTPRGEPFTASRSVNEAEAAIVRRIFAEFAGGSSPRAIAAAT